MSSTPAPMQIIIEQIQIMRSDRIGARPKKLDEGEEFVNLAENLRLIGRQDVPVDGLVEGRNNPDVIQLQSLGEILPGRVVMAAGNGFARVADPSNPANIGRILGVVDGNGQLDTHVAIRTYGPLKGVFDFGGPGFLFSDDNGHLTTQVRNYGFSQIIGFTITGHDVFVSLGAPQGFLEGIDIGVTPVPTGEKPYIVPDADYQVPNDATQLSFRTITGTRIVTLPSWDNYMTARDLVIIDEYEQLGNGNAVIVRPFDVGTRMLQTENDRYDMSFRGATLRLRRCFDRRAWTVC